jgi:alkaline phosphatase D
MKIYRTIPFGRLAEFSVLDTRQYRTDQPCGDGKKPQCAEALDPKATVMGPEQEAWLFASLAKSPATWNVLAQQIMMARVDRVPGEEAAYSMDQWPGYEMNRRRVLDFIAQRKIANPVVLGGDIHSNWANDLVIDWDRKEPVTVASEFVGTSISSSGDGADKNKTTDGILRENPFVKLYNSQRGYVRCEVTPKAWHTDYQVLEYISKPGSPISTRASFAVENGKPGVQTA